MTEAHQRVAAPRADLASGLRAEVSTFGTALRAELGGLIDRLLLLGVFALIVASVSGLVYALASAGSVWPAPDSATPTLWVAVKSFVYWTALATLALGVLTGLVAGGRSLLQRRLLFPSSSKFRLAPGAVLSGEGLTGASFRKADLAGVSMAGLNLTACDFRDAVLSGADLRQAVLRGSDFRRARLRSASLERAILVEALLQRADCTAAKLTKADLREAEMHWTILNYTDIRGADLSTARGLRRRQLQTAIIDEHTKLPFYLNGVSRNGNGRNGSGRDGRASPRRAPSEVAVESDPISEPRGEVSERA